MDPKIIKEKLVVLVAPCSCGSEKMRYRCCGTEEADVIGDEMCPCGSGRVIRDCYFKSPEVHKEMGQ